MGSYDNVPPENPSREEGTSLAARRAKLRGSLAKAILPPDEYTPATMAAGLTSLSETVEQAPIVEPQPLLAESPSASDVFSNTQSNDIQNKIEETVAYPQAQLLSAASMPVVQPTVSPGVQTEALELLINIDQTISDCANHLALLKSEGAVLSASANEILTNIDQSMNVCATNLAALQKISGEQTEVLKALTDTLQNQTLFEIGLNLNNLTESLSAALEPMKAIGELVPAIDQLVTMIEAREGQMEEKISPDQLVTNLADQLSIGAIDSWTFKCAYTAVFPADHPADLLRRLVELLGTQRLSGDLFRAAYEAVQAAEPPPRISTASNSVQIAQPVAAQTEVKIVQDEELKRQLEELREANEKLKASLNDREEEFEQLLAAKDQELQETQELLNARYEEFNSRYEEVTEALNKKEEEYQALLENKDMELSDKEAEAKLLKEQMEELRSQTEEMVKELQKQMTDIKIAKAETSTQQTLPSKPASPQGFFDTAPPTRDLSLFNAAPEKPLFAPEPQQSTPAPQPALQPVTSQPAPQPVTPQPVTPQQAAPQPVTPQQAAPQPVTPQQAAPQPAKQIVPQSAPQAVRQVTPASSPAATYTAGSGSYGSGVRAQVFEVIVRQALAGAPWREICAGPMQVNNITPEEVEAEVKRRQSLLNK